MSLATTLCASLTLLGCSGDNGSASLQLSESKLAFSAGSPATQQLVLSNPVSADGLPLIIDTLYLDERDASNYSVSNDGQFTLLDGESKTIEVSYKASNAEDTAPGALFITHSGTNTVTVVQLQATANKQTDSQTRALNNNVSFGKSTLSGYFTSQPTTLQFGPSGKLYVASMDGTIGIYSVQRNSANNYSVNAVETLTLIKDIPNHNDDGSPNGSVNTRLVTGLAVTGTTNNPVLYVNSSDPRIGGGGSGLSTNLDTNSGVLSKLVKQGNHWTKTDLVRGLPRSEENHHNNGIALSADGNTLFLAMGGNTNMGAPSNNFAKLPEYALSAAILEIDLTQIGNSTYDLPTLDDEDRPGSNDVNDPFGGNRGKNQAKLVPGGPVQVYAPGFRNAYDVVITNSGRMYTWDNGPNAGWGDIPAGNGPNGTCSNAINEPGQTRWDALHYIDSRGYYGGHPNPVRGNSNITYNNSNPQSPVAWSNPVECAYYGPAGGGLGKHPQNKSLTTISSSTNGLTEYTASNFGGAMTGNLLAASFDNKIHYVQLNGSGNAVQSTGALFSNVGQLPLDVTALGDNDLFPGTIWTTDFYGHAIIVFEPSDYDNNGNNTPVCDGSDPLQDSDFDGYSNADENANGTNPCSSADVPSDADGDSLSDLFDSDDDNDNIDDASDPFARDPLNGAGTQIPLLYDWENDSQGAAFIADTGFSGLMSNGSDDYQSLFDLAGMTIRGAAGVITVDNPGSGDALAGANNQQYGFQLGIDVNTGSAVFQAKTSIVSPFSGLTPTAGQSYGLFIGNGDQDNYIKLAIDKDGVRFVREVNGVATELTQNASIINSDTVDLTLEVNPATQTVTAIYQITSNGNAGSAQTVSGSHHFPLGWLTGATKLATGIIATTGPGAEFAATWDFFEIAEVNSQPDNNPPLDTPESPQQHSSPLSTLRINAGGPTITDPNGDWLADTSTSYYNTGSVYSKNVTVDVSQLSVSVPATLFSSERWDPETGEEMQWQIPVTPGNYEVRLYFAEIWTGAFSANKRVYDVSVEGQTVTGLDTYALAGATTALMQSFTVNADSTIDILFHHGIENPDISAIEIIGLDNTPDDGNTPPDVSPEPANVPNDDGPMQPPVFNGTRVCEFYASDSDGDGWGWENGDTCVVTELTGSDFGNIDNNQGPVDDATPDNGETGPQEPSTLEPSTLDSPPMSNGVLVCRHLESDSDGDSWGWENNDSCVVTELTGDEDAFNNSSEPEENPAPEPDNGASNDQVDQPVDQEPQQPEPDNNEGNESQISPPPMVNGTPVCALHSSDSDGDSWGWENGGTCVVTDDTGSFDSPSNNDGNNPVDDDISNNPVEDNSSDNNVDNESPEIVNGNPVCQLPNSDSDGDGWGWENGESCVVVSE